MTSNAPISPQTLEAIHDLFSLPAPFEVDENALLALALGVADEPTRLACARAMLRSPGLQTRYLAVRARVREQLGVGMDPERAVGLPARVGLFVARLAETARSIERLAAEGRWADAEERLRGHLFDLRAAWRLAASSNLWEEAETLVRTLVFPLIEIGAGEEAAELLALGHRVADVLEKPKNRSLLLSYEGVWAARRGDPARARTLWQERAELNRRLGNPVAVADALLDVASSYRENGERERFLGMLDEVERAVAAAGRADLEASFWVLLADDRLDQGDPEGAVEHATRALERARNGENAVGTSSYIRHAAARALTAAGRYGEAIALLGDALDRCVESGLAASAAATLSQLAHALETQGGVPLARRCLTLALAIHRGVGARPQRREEAERALAAFAERHPADDLERLIGTAAIGDSWVSEVGAILAILRDSQSAPALV